MRNSLLLAIGIASLLPLAVQASCDSVSAQIKQKIIENGVPESAFSLQILPNDQVGSAETLVVGHCNNQSQKIIYQRLDERDATDHS